MSRWDRAWLIVLGVISASVGATFLVWHRWINPGRRVVGEPFKGWLGEPWFPWAVAALGVAVVLAGLAWLISQTRRTRDRADRFDAGGGPADAPVSVRARPAADAVAQQAELVPGVISAAARVLSDAPPTIELRLIVDDGYDLTALTGRIDERVRAGLRRTLGRPDAALILRIGLKHAKTGVVDGGTLVAPTASARAIVAPGKVPQITLTQAILPVPALPQPAGWPGGSRPSDHSADSSAATSSGTSTLA